MKVIPPQDRTFHFSFMKITLQLTKLFETTKIALSSNEPHNENRITANEIRCP